ncbi:MAG: DUF3307 domain-containing protein, partial [Flavobacteriaceae bacterium]|nr:DUF3307 domain-containing protein [Flavobacteriaceae bacterium]
HMFVHGILAYILVGEWSNFLLPIIVMIIHFLIDVFKIYQKKKKVKWFLIDQLLHVISLFLIWLFFYQQQEKLYQQTLILLESMQFWLVLLGYILILNPTAIVIYHLTKKWSKEIKDSEKSKKKGLEDAGKWIGILERLLILTFILVGQFSAIGFLLAAKSIFRFGDLTGKKNRKLTEYVLIGTLLSFTITIIIGLILKLFLY